MPPVAPPLTQTTPRARSLGWLPALSGLLATQENEDRAIHRDQKPGINKHEGDSPQPHPGRDQENDLSGSEYYMPGTPLATHIISSLISYSHAVGALSPHPPKG